MFLHCASNTRFGSTHCTTHELKIRVHVPRLWSIRQLNTTLNPLGPPAQSYPSDTTIVSLCESLRVTIIVAQRSLCARGPGAIVVYFILFCEYIILNFHFLIILLNNEFFF